MGTFQRLFEKLRQTKQDPNFKTTGNDRCAETYREAGQFAEQLKEIRRTIRTLRAATEGMLKQTERALSTPLPRVFDTEPGTGKPIPSAPAVMGTDQENIEDGVRVGQLEDIANTTGYKLEQEVLAPMEQWLRLFQGFRGKLDILEKRRLDLDAARRDYNKLEQARVKTTGVEGEKEPPAKLIIKIQAKEVTLNAKRGAFEMYEAQVHEELSQLVGDSGALHKFLEAALRLESHAFESALGPISPSLIHLTEPEAPSILGSQKPGYADSVTTANEYPQAPNDYHQQPEYEQDFPSVPANTGPSTNLPYTATTTKEDLQGTQGPNTPPQVKQPIAA